MASAPLVMNSLRTDEGFNQYKDFTWSSKQSPQNTRSSLVPWNIWLVVLILGLGIGCSRSSEIERYAIDGEVTFNGKPIPGGTIEFEPDSEKGNRGPLSKGSIKDSHFSIDSKRGVVGGAYIVRIDGYSAALEAEPGPGSSTPVQLFPEHSLSVDLPRERSTQTFDVPAKK